MMINYIDDNNDESDSNDESNNDNVLHLFNNHNDDKF